MIFKWLKKLFGLYDDSSLTENPATGEPEPPEPKSPCDELDKRKERIKQNRDKLKQSSTEDLSLRKQHRTLLSSLTELERELEQERLIRLAKEQERKEQEECKRKEREEKERLENEKRVAEERKRRQEKANRLAEEARRKEQTERAERERLEALSTELKDNWADFKRVLEDNGIRYLYHFTDRRNIPSIKRHGGLLSWHYCKINGIVIPCQGGDYNSQELDKKYGLEDFVRLSFCEDHPMAFRLQQSGSDIVILKIKTDVVWLRNTLFSDINAADKLHTHGGKLDD